MSTFATLAAGTCPPHEDMLLATAAELSLFDVAAVHERLDRLSERLPAPGGAPEDELRAVARLLRDELVARPDGDLTLPGVLAAGAGHPVAIVAAAVAAAGRRGLAVDVVGTGSCVWLAHPDAAPRMADPATACVIDGRVLGVDLFWRCAHELAQLTLSLLVARAERSGDLGFALHAARLGAELPVEEGSAGPATRLQRVTARLN